MRGGTEVGEAVAEQGLEPARHRQRVVGRDALRMTQYGATELERHERVAGARGEDAPRRTHRERAGQPLAEQAEHVGLGERWDLELENRLRTGLRHDREIAVGD